MHKWKQKLFYCFSLTWPCSQIQNHWMNAASSTDRWWFRNVFYVPHSQITGCFLKTIYRTWNYYEGSHTCLHFNADHRSTTFIFILKEWEYNQDWLYGTSIVKLWGVSIRRYDLFYLQQSLLFMPSKKTKQLSVIAFRLRSLSKITSILKHC